MIASAGTRTIRRMARCGVRGRYRSVCGVNLSSPGGWNYRTMPDTADASGRASAPGGLAGWLR